MIYLLFRTACGFRRAARVTCFASYGRIQNNREYGIQIQCESRKSDVLSEPTISARTIVGSHYSMMLNTDGIQLE